MNDLRQQYSLVWNEVFMLVLRRELNQATVIYKDVIDSAIGTALRVADDAVATLHNTLNQTVK